MLRRAEQGQMSKFTLRNTVTFSRTLVKSHKSLDGTERFTRSCFRKKLIWKISQKSSPKRNYYEVVSSATSQPPISLKKPSDDWWWLPKRFFRILFPVGTLVNELKELKYLISDLKTSTKFIQKNLWWSPF